MIKLSGFPKHFSDFVENEVSRDIIHRSLLGDITVNYINFGFGSYTYAENENWRGNGVGFGIYSLKFKGKDLISLGGQRKEYADPEHQMFFGVNVIPSEELLAERKKGFNEIFAIGTQPGFRAQYGSVDRDEVWDRYLKGLQDLAERRYNELWGD